MTEEKKELLELQIKADGYNQRCYERGIRGKWIVRNGSLTFFEFSGEDHVNKLSNEHRMNNLILKQIGTLERRKKNEKSA